MTHARTFTAAFLALSITGYSGAQTVKCTTWNLQWFPNGSAKEASAEQQDQRIREAADVLRPINPDIVLLQEVRDQAPPPTTGYTRHILKSAPASKKQRSISKSAVTLHRVAAFVSRETLLHAIETGIPGLRKNVPERVEGPSWRYYYKRSRAMQTAFPDLETSARRSRETH